MKFLLVIVFVGLAPSTFAVFASDNQGPTESINLGGVGYRFPKLAVLKNQNYLAVTGAGAHLSLYDLVTRKLVHTIGESIPYAIDVSAYKQNQLVSASSQAVYFWNVETGESVKNLTFGWSIGAIALNKDQSLLLIGLNDHGVVLWDLNEFQSPVRTFLADTRFEKLVFDEARGLVIARTSDNNIRVWDLNSGSLVRTFPIKTVKTILYDEETGLLYTGSDERKVFVWNVESGTLYKTFFMLSADFNSLKFSQDGKRLISTSAFATVNVWDKLTGKSIHQRFTVRDGPYDVAINPLNGELIVTSIWGQLLFLSLKP